MSQFEDDLAFADGHEDTLRLAYKHAFPECTFISKNGGDNEAQRYGVDRILVRASAPPLLFDEKMRRRAYEGDVLLEHISNAQTGALGWMSKQSPIDYLLCVYLLSRTAVFVGWPLLKMAWGAHGHRWIKHERQITGTTKLEHGARYNTLSVAVPERLLREVGVNILKFPIPYPKFTGGLPPLPTPKPPAQGSLL